jgi:hypothetical protein
MNITQAPKDIQREFRDALKAKDWHGALCLLARHKLTARPCDAPALRDALRADPALLTDGTMVNGRLVDASVLEPERGPHGEEVSGWLTDPQRLESTHPDWRACGWDHQWRVQHALAFGRLVEAMSEIQAQGSSVSLDDPIAGGIARALLQRSGGSERAIILRDGQRFALRRSL